MSSQNIRNLKQMFDEDIEEERQRQRRVERLQRIFAADDQDDDQVRKPRKGSVPGHLVINRHRVGGHWRLYNDYFGDNPVYPEYKFRTRFRMSRRLFERIVSELEQKDAFFPQKYDAAHTPGLTPLQKATAAIRQLAYGVSADATDEYVRLGASTALECLKRFCLAISRIFGDEYLRSPNEDDIKRLLDMAEKRGFPGMLGSLDCMHWEWKNCPAGWKGQYQGKEKKATVILEAVADFETWIWHAFFGLPGTLNDINVLQRSPIFDDLASDVTSPVNFSVNGHNYTKGYYLVDGIYPPWATFMDSITHPIEKKKKLFACMQEAYRKDVERAFGILQSRFAVIRHPARLWQPDDLSMVMRACIILHNMIVEDQRCNPGEDVADDNEAEVLRSVGSAPILTVRRDPNTMSEYLNRYDEIKDVAVHDQLKNDLVEHLWQHQGNMI